MTKSSEAASDKTAEGSTFNFLLIHVGFENLLLSPVPSYPGEDLFLSRLNFTFSFLL